jgi:hypothetical protein
MQAGRAEATALGRSGIPIRKPAAGVPALTADSIWAQAEASAEVKLIR